MSYHARTKHFGTFKYEYDLNKRNLDEFWVGDLRSSNRPLSFEGFWSGRRWSSERVSYIVRNNSAIYVVTKPYKISDSLRLALRNRDSSWEKV